MTTYKKIFFSTKIGLIYSFGTKSATRDPASELKTENISPHYFEELIMNFCQILKMLARVVLVFRGLSKLFRQEPEH